MANNGDPRCGTGRSMDPNAAQVIVQQFNAAQVPPEIGLWISASESSINPTACYKGAINSDATGLWQMISSHPVADRMDPTTTTQYMLYHGGAGTGFKAAFQQVVGSRQKWDAASLAQRYKWTVDIYRIVEVPGPNDNLYGALWQRAIGNTSVRNQISQWAYGDDEHRYSPKAVDDALAASPDGGSIQETLFTPIGDATHIIQGIPNPLDAVSGVLGNIVKPSFWFRVLLVIGALVILLYAVKTLGGPDMTPAHMIKQGGEAAEMAG